MSLVPVKTPNIIKRMLPEYIWDIPTNENVIYLTFDDGPTPEITNWTLDVLKQYNAKATFFCIGNNIEKHPEIFQNILDDEHSIGNHTQNHLKGWTTTNEDYFNNIEEAQNIITSEIQKSKIKNHQSLISNLFRPPYGQITPKQGKKLIESGYKIIMWNVLSFDWDNAVTKEKCLENVISKASKGSIIVFHDSIKASRNMQYALPKMLDYFSEKGFCFKKL